MCETAMHFYPYKIKQTLRGCYKKASQKGWCKNIERTEKLDFFQEDKQGTGSPELGCRNGCYGNVVFWYDLKLQTWELIECVECSIHPYIIMLNLEKSFR